MIKLFAENFAKKVDQLKKAKEVRMTERATEFVQETLTKLFEITTEETLGFTVDIPVDVNYDLAYEEFKARGFRTIENKAMKKIELAW